MGGPNAPLRVADDAAALDQARGQLADLLFYLET